MIEGKGAVTQALLGTLLTWGLTAAGAACVFFVRGKQRKLLDVSLGFAAGVMTAASYWSLLDPAITLCEKQGIYGKFAFLPVALGFLLGAVFVFGTDVFLDYLGLNSTNMMMSITKSKEGKEKMEDLEMMTALNRPSVPTSVVTLDPPQPTDFADCINNQHSAQRRRGHHHSQHSLTKGGENGDGDRRDSAQRSMEARASQWKRIMLLVVAITVHNIPEGLAVGVSFGAAAMSEDSSNAFHVARNAWLGRASTCVPAAILLRQGRNARHRWSGGGGAGISLISCGREQDAASAAPAPLRCTGPASANRNIPSHHPP
ncbi:hypothetical protein MSG28_005117 [Choristoneura fumiferana]|uniref:Uncharacterized protein n=1 Tax=Choristoneura fumiferana TaxID=7141 RepID=A0ACC0JQ72_CHOFU|nr:hypothetical protein MSG28_005117 [Choristoneura fumiferana]